MEQSFESITRNNQRPSTSPVRLVRSTSEAGATEHFPSPLQQEGEEFVFGGMEENVYTGNDDENEEMIPKTKLIHILYRKIKALWPG